MIAISISWGCLSEHLEFSDTKITMGSLIVFMFCMIKERYIYIYIYINIYILIINRS